MNDKVLTELLAMRARLDDIIAQVRAQNDVPAKPEPSWMKVSEFCARWSISRSAFYARVADGLPVRGAGHDRRINVKAGDEWMERRTGSKRAA